MTFVADVALFLSVQLSFWLVGFPLSFLLASAHVRGHVWAAPIFGCVLLGVGTTLLYRVGVPAGCSMLMFLGTGVVASFAILVAARAALRKQLQTLLIWCGISALVGLLRILPKLTGGQQFAAFQGNIYDLDVEIKSSTGIFPGDSRSLGIALRTVRFSR